jgi:hypothetical protein
MTLVLGKYFGLILFNNYFVLSIFERFIAVGCLLSVVIK